MQAKKLPRESLDNENVYPVKCPFSPGTARGFPHCRSQRPELNDRRRVFFVARWPDPHRRVKVKPFDKRLSVAETTHVSGPAGETAKSGLGVETRWAVEARRAVETRSAMETRPAMETRSAGEAAKTGGVVEATGAGAESGEPKEGIAPAVIRPIIVTLRTLGIAAAARRDTTVIRVILGKGVARRAGRLDRGWSRSAQYGRGRERGGGLRWGC
jgi:hypothetical protein